MARKRPLRKDPSPKQPKDSSVSPIPEVDRQRLFQEISSNSWRLGFSQERLLNSDELIGRKGQRVYRQMLSDDQVKAALTLKKHAILSTGWDIEPASDSAQDVEVADFCRWAFQHMEGSLDDDLYEILSGLESGYSITELAFRPITKGDYSGKVGLRALKTRIPDDFIFRVDQHDNLLENGIEQFGKKMPTWKFAIFSHQKSFDNWYGTSDLRAAYRSWWLKDFVMKAWGIFLDRYSVPLALGTYPPSGVQDTQVSAFRSALENLQLATTMTMPDDFKVDFPAVGAQGSSVFALAIDRQDQAIARAILVPNLLGVSPQGNVGSFSQARKQFDVFILVIEKLQRDLSETVMGEQIIKRLVDLNYRVEEYPKFIFLPFTETDKSQLLSLWYQAVAAGGVINRPEDEAHIRMVTEFPEVPLEQLKAEAEAAKAQPPPGEAPVETIPPVEPEDTTSGEEEEELSDEDLDSLIDEVLSKEKKNSQQYASDFDEGEHPREEDGKFAPQGGGRGSLDVLSKRAQALGVSPEVLQKLSEEGDRVSAAFSPMRNTPWEPGMATQKEKTQGNCYQYAARFMTDGNYSEAKLIHGTIIPPIGPLVGELIGHAWVDLGDKVFDPTLQRFYQKSTYEKAYQPVVEKVYSIKDTSQQMLKTKNYGPWHETKGKYNMLRKRRKDG